MEYERVNMLELWRIRHAVGVYGSLFLVLHYHQGTEDGIGNGEKRRDDPDPHGSGNCGALCPANHFGHGVHYGNIAVSAQSTQRENRDPERQRLGELEYFAGCFSVRPVEEREVRSGHGHCHQDQKEVP